MVTANAAQFGLQSGKHYISGQSKKDRYLAYQHEYHCEYGVFPELDLINKPFTALFDDIREGHLQIIKKALGAPWHIRIFITALTKNSESYMINIKKNGLF